MSLNQNATDATAVEQQQKLQVDKDRSDKKVHKQKTDNSQYRQSEVERKEQNLEQSLARWSNDDDFL